MITNKPAYRKNLGLGIAFLFLISVSFVLAMILAYNLTRKYIENEFSSKKIEVFEQTIKPYNEFFQNSIPEISYYQGYLDSASAARYVAATMATYPFIEKALFYDIEISNHLIEDGFRVENFSIGPKAIYQFGPEIAPDSVVLFKKEKSNSLSLKIGDEFNKMAIKLSGLIESADTTQILSEDQIFSIFYSINPNRITYLNIARREELGTFKELMFNKRPSSPVFEKDMFTFYLNSKKLPIHNTRPDLYQQIYIVPLVYEPLSEESAQLNTEIALPGAFAAYKLYLSSSPKFLRKEINRRFLPIAGLLLLIYSFLAIIAYLIYRNLFINQRMFKLQYDFINNFTHEFKTPVSVIKVAGNNISNSSVLTDKERLHYGKILDEEADKLNDLMNRLLSFTQIENKAIKLKTELIDLNVFCQKRVEAYQLNKPEFKITYKLTNINHFKTDPVLLLSLFNNLMDNAFKYSPSEGQQLHIDISKSGQKIIFKFKDRGIGIEKKDVNHIFKKFYRIESAYNQQGSAGLGLAFCKELVKFMNGDIFVKSEPGKGSEFIVQLPYQV